MTVRFICDKCNAAYKLPKEALECEQFHDMADKVNSYHCRHKDRTLTGYRQACIKCGDVL